MILWLNGPFGVVQRALELLEPAFEVIEVRTPLPWTMALCRVRTIARS